ncbi:MAG TPA: hypothetical protein VEI01_17130 [Terriglobales bacterium]|nr:hypothetical protein [Terriglobales bacterium]
MKFLAALVVPNATFPKDREAGVIVTGFVPVPVRVMVWEPASTLSLTVMVPVNVPVAVGVKVMEIEHLAPAAS